MRLNLSLLLGCLLLSSSLAYSEALRLNSCFSDNMVLQRESPVQVCGVGEPGTTVTVTFAGQIQSGKVGDDAEWSVTLEPLQASAKPQLLMVGCSNGQKAVIGHVLIGDVLLFARQTWVDISLGRSEEGAKAAARFKPVAEFRAMTIETVPAKEPQADLDTKATSGWTMVDRENALTMSAAAFYLGRDLVEELGVPVGIIDVNMGPHFGIGWLSSKALADAITLHPDDKEIDWLPEWLQERAEERDSGEAQEELDEYFETRMKGQGQKPSLGLHPLRNPMYPSAGYNAVIHPLRGMTFKSVLLQLGNDYPFIAYRELDRIGKATLTAELNAAWQENYLILKCGYRVTPVTLPYVPGDWRRAFANKDLSIGLILPPASDLDVYAAHNREIRELHRRTAAKAEGIGLIMPGTRNIPASGQPADDKLLAERCKHWMLGAVYGEDGVMATGPALDRIEARLTKATIHFKEGTAQGLKAAKGSLDLFETAGPDRVFAPATARINGSTIELSSDGPIQFVRYNWTEKPDQGLVNDAGLPALPFSTDADWTFAWIPPPEDPQLPEEYGMTADKWGKSDVAIINGQIASMEIGDAEPIPRRPGPLGIVASPFGPNIYVVETEPGGPADGKLMPGDVIYGVNGKTFDDGPDVAHDAQYMALSKAITYSESDEGQGKLILSVRRGVRTIYVELQLRVLGTYSSTTPYYCEKSESIVRDAEAWSARQYRPESGPASAPIGMLNTDLYFLLASGTPEHQGLVRRAIYGMMAKMEPKPVTAGMKSKPWHTGYTSVLFGEYFHATGDRNVLPYLKYQADLSAESQLKPPEETLGEWEAAQTEMQVGGWRQNSHTAVDRWQSGYGLMPHAGIPCVMGMQLAKEAGLEIDELALSRGLEHFNKGRAEYGFVLYSYGSLRKDGPPLINPEAEAAGKLWSMNGKLGTAAALYSMVGVKDSVDICARHCIYGFNNTRHGHGGMFFNNFWTPIGAWAGGEMGFKHFMKGQTWWRELFRRHDGSFNQVGRGRIGVSYALPYVAPKKRLRMLGAPRSAFGVDTPDYLKAALEAHKKRDYALCEELIMKQMNESILPAEDMPVVNHMLGAVQTIQASIDHDLALTASLIEDGKHYYASLELPQLRGVVAEDDPRLVAIVQALESPEGVAAIAKHRKACDEEGRAIAAKKKEVTQSGVKEKWVGLLEEPDGKGSGEKWQMKVVEHISHAPEAWMSPKFDDSSWNVATPPISWTMYHTALFRTTFNVEDKDALDALRIKGGFFQQANVVIYLNGKLVAKVDNLGRGGGTTDARLTDYAMKLLKEGENTVAISSRHKRRWGSYRGKYVTAATINFTVEGRAADE